MRTLERVQQKCCSQEKGKVKDKTGSTEPTEKDLGEQSLQLRLQASSNSG